MPQVRDSSAGAPPDAVGSLVQDRYRILRVAGRGGMAFVYEAEDTRTGERIALKRLLVQDSAETQRRAAELFEQEFQTLSQLAHPRIVEVFDYAVDARGAFYTMELLSGGDAGERVPMDWPAACAMVRDVSSALALLHSRRMVHRDLSPRNVRCTADGTAKLIDFGAMVPMGRNRHVVVGTPAYCAPEALQQQALDARVDLYALGATLYYTLTGRHAYPAKDFASLWDLWRTELLPPSTFNRTIPEALDGLVLSLLSQDPEGRPTSAAEVMERVSAIAGGEVDERLVVVQAYLATPNLVGRRRFLSRMRSRMRLALAGRGGAAMVSGATGVGRSRFLDACLLEAKLLGATTVRVDASDAVGGDYGAVRAIARQLLHVHRQGTLEAASRSVAILAHVIPELKDQLGARPLAELGAEARPRIQGALRTWLLELSRHHAIVLGVDDAHRVDEASAALIALIVDDIRDHSLYVVATIEQGADAVAPRALDLLGQRATHVALRELPVEETEVLLSSVFGDVPNVGLLAHRLFRVAAGNPRATMRLAQHLVDRNVIHYQGGSWFIPDTLDEKDLPQSMADELMERVRGLSDDARALAGALALVPDQALSSDELLLLTDHGHVGRLAASVEALVRVELVDQVEERVSIAHPSSVSILRGQLTAQQTTTAHRRLAGLFESRGGAEFRVGQHLLRAGEQARGLQVLVSHARASREETSRDGDAFYRLMQSLPADWLETYEHAIELAQKTGEPPATSFQIRSRLTGCMAHAGFADPKHMIQLLDELKVFSGLSAWDALAGESDPKTRLMKALAETRARYEATPPEQRVVDPGVAIRSLARAMVEAAGIVNSTLDARVLGSLPSLRPLSSLSPALGVIDHLINGMRERQSGRFEKAREQYLALLDRAAQPDRAGMDESHHRYMRLGVMNGMGMIEAGMGLESALTWTAEIERNPTHGVNAVQTRMLYYLWQGDIREAARCKRVVEALRIQNSPRQWFEGTHLMWQIAGAAAAEDLTRVKQTTEELEPLARNHPGWLPAFQYGMAEYERIRGDHTHALERVEAALACTKAGESQLWANVAGCQVDSLAALGRLDEALEVGRAHVAAAAGAELGYVKAYLLMPLGVVLAKLGHQDEAISMTEQVIQTFEKLGSTGLNPSLAYEARARVAIALSNHQEFERFSDLSVAALGGVDNSTIRAKRDRLRRALLRAPGEGGWATRVPETSEILEAQRIASTLNACSGLQERAECLLTLIANAYGVSDGLLYLVGDERPFFAAQMGDLEWPASVHELAERYLTQELQDNLGTTGEDPETDTIVQWPADLGTEYRPILLSHDSIDGMTITGVAVLPTNGSTQTAEQLRLVAELSKQMAYAGDVAGVTLVG